MDSGGEITLTFSTLGGLETLQGFKFRMTMKTKNHKLLEQFNKAFADNDTDFLAEHVTNNIKWTAVGDFTVEGKEAFIEALKNMLAGEPWEMEIDDIITHGNVAAVNGSMKSKDGKQYAFCDIYCFDGFTNAKIQEMTSYAVEIKK